MRMSFENENRTHVTHTHPHTNTHQLRAGAEIWWNKDSDLESTSSDSSIDNDDEEEDDMDMEMAAIDRNEILGDADIESTLAADDLIDHAPQHEFNKYLLKRNAADTSLDSIDFGTSDLIHTSIKRPRAADGSPMSDEASHGATQHVDTS